MREISAPSAAGRSRATTSTLPSPLPAPYTAPTPTKTAYPTTRFLASFDGRKHPASNTRRLASVLLVKVRTSFWSNILVKNEKGCCYPRLPVTEAREKLRSRRRNITLSGVQGGCKNILTVRHSGQSEKELLTVLVKLNKGFPYPRLPMSETREKLRHDRAPRPQSPYHTSLKWVIFDPQQFVGPYRSLPKKY